MATTSKKTAAKTPAAKPRSGETTNRAMRIDDEDWEIFERACAAMGLTRSARIRMFIKQTNEEYLDKQAARGR